MLTNRNLDHRINPANPEAPTLSGPSGSPFAFLPPNRVTDGKDGGDGGNDACKIVVANLSAYN